MNEKQIKKPIEKKNLSNITQKWVDLLIPFSNNYSAKLSASELARKSKNPLSIEIMKNHVLFGDVSKIVDIFWRKEYG